MILGWTYEQKRMFPEALAELRTAVQLSGDAPLTLASYGHALAASGDRRGAGEVLEKLLALAKARYVSAYDIAIVYAGLGDRERAFHWLDQAQRERSSFLPYITWDRRADNLRSDARFHLLLQRLGLRQTESAALRRDGAAAVIAAARLQRSALTRLAVPEPQGGR